MKRNIEIIFIMLCMVFSFCSFAIGADDITLENQVITSGQVVHEFAANSITAGPAYVINTGADVSLHAGNRITLKPGFKVEHGAKFQAIIFGTDVLPPEVISAYPADGSVVPTQGGNLTLLVTFGDACTGVGSVTLLDAAGNDITAQATITSNTVEYIIENPLDGAYLFTVVLDDNIGNTSSIPINFTVDSTVPVTTPSIAGGAYSSDINVELMCSEAATIYYSTDGYPPFVGASNTIGALSPVQLQISQATNLQFFAVDAAGNIETTHSEIYLVGEIPGDFVNPTATYSESQNRVELSWEALAYPCDFQVYRCANAIDMQILNKSREGGYPPPQKLRLTPNEISNTFYNDIDISQGAQYWYGVTVINSGREGAVSQLIPIEVPVAGPAQNKVEAVNRAVAWLEKIQHTSGYWGQKPGMRLLATAQVLDAMQLTGKDNAGLRQAVFYLKGQFADNNDYLSRKIITLNNYGMNTDQLVNRLIAQADIQGLNIIGFGLQKRFVDDAIDTALGTNALQRTSQNLTNATGDQINNYGWSSLKNNAALQSSEPGRFGWVAGEPSAVFVSAYVYQTILNFSTLNHDSQWIFAGQSPDGSFGNGAFDTAAVLLWMSPPEQQKNDAVNYLIAQQSLNGSWLEDAYLTGLCLEALLTAN